MALEDLTDQYLSSVSARWFEEVSITLETGWFLGGISSTPGCSLTITDNSSHLGDAALLFLVYKLTAVLKH